MPPRSNPTARQVRLGSELRKLREASGMLAKEAGTLLGGGSAQISHIEAGRWGVSPDRVRHMAKLYSCGDAALVQALSTMADDHRSKHWWHAYRGILAPGFLDISELEHHATYIKCLQPVTFPGVLQTEEYARALFGSVIPRLPDEELDARVEHRLRRRVILEQESPPPFEAIIHEAALRMRAGSRKTAREQLEHLTEVAGWPCVTLRVIPFAQEDFIEVTQTLMYAGAVVPQLDTVHCDTPFGGRYLDTAADLDKYQALLDGARRASLSPEESRVFIHRIAQEL
ncbi:helix-turn-helix domain-containing protein [Streptomyces sp. HU2014]|uniref:helix-turn-helix domain-containing protein n=1 Tax=Streptomyces sp. HU2014 TaxID=2939414 RepID=UPI00201036DA|nr:helix-turn-helix transcriptional regulator [Streptomyces sp. HU2014]UQI43771.1 helix-turn-helix domain-containing protein [Streptomyces sp. HU2014]